MSQNFGERAARKHPQPMQRIRRLRAYERFRSDVNKGGLTTRGGRVASTTTASAFCTCAIAITTSATGILRSNRNGERLVLGWRLYPAALELCSNLLDSAARSAGDLRRSRPAWNTLRCRHTRAERKQQGDENCGEEAHRHHLNLTVQNWQSPNPSWCPRVISPFSHQPVYLTNTSAPNSAHVFNYSALYDHL